MADFESHLSYGPFEAGTSPTTFGRWMVTPTSATHVYVDANHNSASDLGNPDGLRVTVRGIPYGVSAHLYLHDDGSWGDGNDPDARPWYMSRLDRYNGPRDLYASPAAEKAARAMVTAEVSAWLASAAGKAALAEAARVDRNNRKYRAEMKAAALREQMAELQPELDNLSTN